MINWIKRMWAERQARLAEEARLAALAEEKRIEAERKANTELFTISLGNVRYLNGVINVTSAMVNQVKGKTGPETRKRREDMRRQIEWYERKLWEEKGMTEYFGELAGIPKEEYIDIIK